MLKWCLLLAAILASASTVIHVRPQRQVQDIPIKLGEETELDYPDFPFSDIYDRQIWQTNNLGQEILLDDICRFRAAYVELNATSTFSFWPNEKPKSVIYDFEDIQKLKGVVDMHYYSSVAIYVVFENGTLTVFELQNNQLAVVRHMLFPNTSEIGYGEFHAMHEGARLLFVTDANIFLVTFSNITIMDGYHPSSTSFSGAVPIGKKYLAVAYETLGVVFYEMVSDWYMKQSGGYAAAFFNRTSISVQDIAYDEDSSTLLILDGTYGVYACEVHLNPEGHLRMSILPKGVHKRGCYFMMLLEGELYLACQQMFKVGILTDSMIETLPNPMFKVKKMSMFKNLLVLMGENFFKIYHNDRLVEDFQYDRMDYFKIVSDNNYISASEQGLIYGNYKLDPPVVLCHTANSQHQGETISALVRTEAQCNASYFEKYSLDIGFNATDTCIYTTPVNLHMWKPQDLNLLPAMMLGVVFILAGLALLVWACVVRRQVYYLIDLLKSYKKKTADAQPKQEYNVVTDQLAQTKQLQIAIPAPDPPVPASQDALQK